MRYLWLIAQREFIENVKTKGFWLGIFLLPAILLLAGIVPSLLAKKGTSGRHFVILDATSEFEPILRQQLNSSDVAMLPAPERSDAVGSDSTDSQEPTAVPGAGVSSSSITGISDSEDPIQTLFAAKRFIQTRIPLDVPIDDWVQAESVLREHVRGNRSIQSDSGPATLFAAIILPPRFGTDPTIEWRYWSQNPADPELKSRVESVLDRELQRREYVELGLDPEVITRIQRTRSSSADMDARKPVGRERVGLTDQLKLWLPSFFVYLLWVAIMSIAQMLLNGVIEEKSNRVIEVLLSSVTPGELMLGKLTGIAGVGLIMIGTWLSTLIGVALWQTTRLSNLPATIQSVTLQSASQETEVMEGSGSGSGPAIANLQVADSDSVRDTHTPGSATTESTVQPAPPQIQSDPMAHASAAILQVLRTTWLIPACVFYFFMGYTLYAALFLTIGSLCNTIKDAQTLFAPLILVLMVPLFLMPFIPRDPHGTLATVLSWIPIYTPFIMMNRITASPPLLDLIGTTLLLVGFNVLVFWGCGRIFRMGILRTGQPPRLMELFRWIRHREG